MVCELKFCGSQAKYGVSAIDVKERLLNLIKLAHNEEQALFTKLSSKERSAVGKLEQWSAKDLIAHLAVWKERMIQNIMATLRNKNLPIDGDLDEINAKIFEVNKNSSWDETLAYAERACRSAIECVRAVPHEKLVDSNTLPWQEGRPLWRIIAGNSYIHPIAHLAEYYCKREDNHYATKLCEKAADLLTKLSDSPDWLGVVKYNLACCYALSGQQEKAIIRLRESLELNPDLTEWSKGDPDIASLRERPDYQSIYSK